MRFTTAAGQHASICLIMLQNMKSNIYFKAGNVKNENIYEGHMHQYRNCRGTRGVCGQHRIEW